MPTGKYKHKPLTIEHRKAISLRLMGQKPWNTGKHLSEETKRKLSLFWKGKPESAETRKRMSEWQIQFPGENQTDRDLRKTYGITENQYNKMLESQKGLCAICRKQEVIKNKDGSVRRLSVDHNHNTKEVRGLLCSNCNHLIGKAKDSIPLLKSAIKYLSEYGIFEYYKH